ncbi:MAG: hypothetical protein ABJF86_13600 [Tateyamaria sp.]|uniref:hypothetical protein n=1 Tax=Tateyamaria sp. TaxID=1929288 RepID=UPI0032952A3F
MKGVTTFLCSTLFAIGIAPAVLASSDPGRICHGKENREFVGFAELGDSKSLWQSFGGEATIIFLDNANRRSVTARRVSKNDSLKMRAVMRTMFTQDDSLGFDMADAHAVMAAFSHKRFVRDDDVTEQLLDCISKGIR